MQKPIISTSTNRFAWTMLFVWIATYVFIVIVYTIYPWESMDSFIQRAWMYAGLADIFALSKL